MNKNLQSLIKEVRPCYDAASTFGCSSIRSLLEAANTVNRPKDFSTWINIKNKTNFTTELFKILYLSEV